MTGQYIQDAKDNPFERLKAYSDPTGGIYIALRIRNGVLITNTIVGEQVLDPKKARELTPIDNPVSLARHLSFRSELIAAPPSPVRLTVIPKQGSFMVLPALIRSLSSQLLV